jgi:hypothetical protein
LRLGEERAPSRDYIGRGKVLIAGEIQGLGKGIPILCYGRPAGASGQGGMVGRMEKGSGC